MKGNIQFSVSGVLLFMGGKDDKVKHLKGQAQAWLKMVHFFQEKLMMKL